MNEKHNLLKSVDFLVERFILVYKNEKANDKENDKKNSLVN